MQKQIRISLFLILSKEIPEVGRDAVFMAGSPGAGKSEVAIGLAENYDNHVIIDADYFRTQFPDYNGKTLVSFKKHLLGW